MMRLLVLLSLLAAGLTALAAPEVEPKAPKIPPAIEPKDETPPGEVDVGKATERIIKDAKEAGKRLGDKDPGDDTQRLQKEIVKNIDALIKKAQEPPPPSSGDSSQSSKSDGMGNDSTSKKPKNENSGESTSNSSQSRKERREKQRAQANGKQNSQPMPQPRHADRQAQLGNPSDRLNKIEPKTALPHFPDAYKDVWGHLPEKMRQEMDLYFREQFMPRYSELLKQYYSSLSERGGKTTNGP